MRMFLDIWRAYAEKVSGGFVQGSGHFIPEEQPEQLKRLWEFFPRLD